MWQYYLPQGEHANADWTNLSSGHNTIDRDCPAGMPLAIIE